MGSVHRLSEYSKSSTPLFFNRHELNHLLKLYSTRVMRGEWRDYAISHAPGMARFCVFKSTHEQPLFTITKIASTGRHKAMAKKGRYVVASAVKKLKQTNSLEEALKVLDNPVKLVKP